MLKRRVLTAAVLGPLFLLGVLYLPPLYFSLLAAAAVLGGAWEWTRLSGYDGAAAGCAAVAVLAAFMALSLLYRDAVVWPVLVLACGAWLAVSIGLFRHRESAVLDWPGPARLAAGLAVLLPAWLAIATLQGMRPGAAALLFLLVWAADIGAYFAGRRWGRRRLAPAISPGKTLEGLWGGLAGAAVVAAVFAAGWSMDAARFAVLLGLALLAVLMSVFGDLFESNWKRVSGVKDSGGLLPGHGGVLDRIDSMTAAAPFYTLGWFWWLESAAA